MKRLPPSRVCLLALAVLWSALLPCALSAATNTGNEAAAAKASKPDLVIAQDIRRASDALTALLANPPKVKDDEAFVLQLEKAKAALQSAQAAFPRVPDSRTDPTQKLVDPAAILDAARKNIEEAVNLANKEGSSSATTLQQALSSSAEARKQLADTTSAQPVAPAAPNPGLPNTKQESGSRASTLLGWLTFLLSGSTIALLLFLLFRLRRLQTPRSEDSGALDAVLTDLETRATDAAVRYKNLSANYDQLEEQYNELAAQHEQLSTQLADLRRQPKAPPAREMEPPDSVPEPPNPAPPVLPVKPPELPTLPAEPVPITIPQPAPVPSFGSDPERDYLEARLKPDLQAEFKRIHSPVVVTCTNLSQRGVTGVQLTFVQDNRSSLFAVVNPANALIFPSFASDPAFARDLLEGIYAYPAEFNDLTIVAAAQAERKGDTFYLTRPGQLRNA